MFACSTLIKIKHQLTSAAAFPRAQSKNMQYNQRLQIKINMLIWNYEYTPRPVTHCHNNFCFVFAYIYIFVCFALFFLQASKYFSFYVWSWFIFGCCYCSLFFCTIFFLFRLQNDCKLIRFLFRVKNTNCYNYRANRLNSIWN